MTTYEQGDKSCLNVTGYQLIPFIRDQYTFEYMDSGISYKYLGWLKSIE